MTRPPCKRLVSVCTALVVFNSACGDRTSVNGGATVIAADPTRLAAAQQRLASDTTMGWEMADGTRPCHAPIPGYHGCEREGRQVLLLASGNYGGAGSQVDALLWVPPGRPAKLSMLFWHFDSLGTPLGHGWHHVTAISHID